MTLDRAQLAQSVAAQGRIARVVIAAHKGSAPRETGAAMLVTATTTQGTIGGGALEYAAIAHARSLLPSAQSSVTRHPLGPELGQCCGGHVTLLTEVFTAETLAQIPRSGLYARPTGADQGTPPPTIPHTLRNGWFAEPIAGPYQPLWIHGAGHVGRALVHTLHDLPFQVTWVDDARARFPDHIPDHATMLVAANPVHAARHAPPNAHHLVLTYSHALDLDLCHQILSQPFSTLGLIGSATKRARFLNRLAALGHSPETLARLTCPIGDPALGKHPTAIAVSVVHALLLPKAATQSGTTSRGHLA